MRTFSFLLAGCLCLSLAGPAAAGRPELYFLGGPVLADLGGEAVDFGGLLASQLDSVIGGGWRSQKTTMWGGDIGAGCRFSGNSPWSGAVELRYATRGTRYELTADSLGYPDVEVKLNLDYVEIPLLLEYAPPSQAKVRPVLLLGPLLGIRVGSDLSAESGGSGNSTDIDEIMAGTYFAVVFGAGVRIRTAERSAALVQVRYTLGLSNVFESAFPYSAKPQDFSLLVGYSVRM